MHLLSALSLAISLLLIATGSAHAADSNAQILKDQAKVAGASIKASSYDASARVAAAQTLSTLSSLSPYAYSGGYAGPYSTPYPASYSVGPSAYGGSAFAAYPPAQYSVGPSAYGSAYAAYPSAQYNSGYGLGTSYFPGYPAPYGPVDSVQAQGARSLAGASNNVGALLTIRNNNRDLFSLPMQIMGIDNAVDATTQAIFNGGSPFGYGYDSGYGGSSYGFPPTSSYAPRGSTGAAWNAASTINSGLYDYLDGRSKIGSSAEIWDTVQNTHASFNQALSNAAANQRVAHEAAYSAASLPPLPSFY